MIIEVKEKVTGQIHGKDIEYEPGLHRPDAQLKHWLKMQRVKPTAHKIVAEAIPPCENDTKSEIKDWMDLYGVEYDTTDTKEQLLEHVDERIQNL